MEKLSLMSFMVHKRRIIMKEAAKSQMTAAPLTTNSEENMKNTIDIDSHRKLKYKRKKYNAVMALKTLSNSPNSVNR